MRKCCAGRRRWITAVLVAVQAGMIAFVVPLDALVDRAHSESAPHVESPESPACSTGHGFLCSCQVVRSLSKVAASSQAALLQQPSDVLAQLGVRPSDLPPPRRAFLLGGVTPRGPPAF